MAEMDASTDELSRHLGSQPRPGFSAARLIVSVGGERVADHTVGEAARYSTAGVSEPLGLRDTVFRPSASDRIVATEVQLDPPRGLVRGDVHDETAWALGGVAGNAGLFSTADDMHAFAEALRLDRLPASMLTNQLPAGVTAAYGQAIGPRIGDRATMGVLADRGIGHTGFTSTSLLIDPVRELSIVLLTNRVHPRREWADPAPLRWAIAAHTRALVERRSLDVW